MQERLTIQVANELKNILKTQRLAVIIDAEHMCVSSRGIKDVNSSTVTSFYGGDFEKVDRKKELIAYLNLPTKKIHDMGLFRRKTKIDKLKDKYRKLMADAHRLSTLSRKLSDQKVAEAQEILIKIDQIEVLQKM